MLRCNILAVCLGCSCLVAEAQGWQVVRENPQKSFPKTVAAGNYSGITHLHDDIYAVVSDKSDSALYFNFRIQVNPETGDLEHVENLGFVYPLDGNAWHGKEKGLDHEAIVRVSDSTLVVASEGYCRLKEYPIIRLSAEPSAEPSAGQNPCDTSSAFANRRLWERKWNSADFYPNYNFESLAFDSVRQCLWTVSESTLRKDGQPSTPQNGLANKLRLMAFDWRKRKGLSAGDGTTGALSQMPTDEALPQMPTATYAYQMDEPSTSKTAQTYVMGVSELCALPDGQLLVLEREAFIPKIKLGAFCKCKLYLIDPLHSENISIDGELNEKTPYLKKRLLTEWKTVMTLSRHTFANYEGMCLGPKLEDGAQVVILLSDSQDQYAGVLKDWFKTIVIKKQE